MKATSTEVASRHEQCLVRDEHQQILEQRRLERSVHVERGCGRGLLEHTGVVQWRTRSSRSLITFAPLFFKGKCHTSIVVVQYFTQHEQQKFILKVCLGSLHKHIFSNISVFLSLTKWVQIKSAFETMGMQGSV